VLVFSTLVSQPTAPTTRTPLISKNKLFHLSNLHSCFRLLVELCVGGGAGITKEITGMI